MTLLLHLTRHMCNDIVKRNLFLLISAAAQDTKFEEFDDIEEAIVSDDAEAKTRLKALVEKVNGLGLLL